MRKIRLYGSMVATRVPMPALSSYRFAKMMMVANWDIRGVMTLVHESPMR